jgi:hypothetical protein
MEVLLHLELLELIAGIDNQLLGLVTLQQDFDVLLAEGTGTASDQDGFVVEHVLRDAHQVVFAA